MWPAFFFRNRPPGHVCTSSSPYSPCPGPGKLFSKTGRDGGRHTGQRSRKKRYTPMSGHKASFRGERGWGSYFEAPRSRGLIRPPLFHTFHPSKAIFRGVGVGCVPSSAFSGVWGWAGIPRRLWCVKFGPVKGISRRAGPTWTRLVYPAHIGLTHCFNLLQGDSDQSDGVALVLVGLCSGRSSRWTPAVRPSLTGEAICRQVFDQLECGPAWGS